MPDVLYVVMCGKTHVQLEELVDEDEAVTMALMHDQAHHCSPWVQYPLEHVHRADDDA